MNEKPIYSGFHQDKHGVTMLGRIVLDAWLFGLIPETEDCAGWQLGQMQALTDRVEAEWDKYGNLPHDLRERHAALYKMAVERAREKGWDPELSDED